MSWTLRLLPGGGPCEALPVALARLVSEWWGCASVMWGASWTGVGDRGVEVVGTSMAPVRILVEDDSPCCGRRPAAPAPGAARVPCLLVRLRLAALHP